MNKNHYYRLYWKSDEFGTKDFEVCGIFSSTEEAKNVIGERKMGKAEIYKIVEVKDGVEVNVDYSHQNYSSDVKSEEVNKEVSNANYPDVVIKIDRNYIESDLATRESDLLNKDGTLDDEDFDAIAHELFTNVAEFIDDCYDRAEHGIEREKRNKNAKDLDPHYRVYWKNPNAYISEFKVMSYYKTLEDAEDLISEEFKDEFTTFQIRKFECNSESVIKTIDPIIPKFIK